MDKVSEVYEDLEQGKTASLLEILQYDWREMVGLVYDENPGLFMAKSGKSGDNYDLMEQVSTLSKQQLDKMITQITGDSNGLELILKQGQKIKDRLVAYSNTDEIKTRVEKREVLDTMKDIAIQASKFKYKTARQTGNIHKIRSRSRSRRKGGDNND